MTLYPAMTPEPGFGLRPETMEARPNHSETDVPYRKLTRIGNDIRTRD